MSFSTLLRLCVWIACVEQPKSRKHKMPDFSVNSKSTVHTYLHQCSSLMLGHATRSLGPESNSRKQVESSCAVFTLTHVSRHSVLHGSGAGHPGKLVKSGRGYWSRSAEKTTRRAQRADGLFETTVNGLTEAVRAMGQPVSKPRPEDLRVGRPEPYIPGKDFDDFNLRRKRWYTQLRLFNPAESSETVGDSGGGDATTRTGICNAIVLSYNAHTERSAEDREERRKQLFEAW